MKTVKARPQTKRPARRTRLPGESLHHERARLSGTRILDGTYQPQSHLPNEAEWGVMFGASRTAVREAMKTLTGKGLVVSRPKVGTRVEPRERWNLLDRDVMTWHAAAMDQRSLLLSIQEVRRIIEPGAAELAARRRTSDQLGRLGAALESMASAADAGDMVAPDVAFHLALLDAANNDLLLPFGIIIEQALHQMFDYTSRHNPKPLGVIPLHRDVVEAVARHDPEAARRAVLTLLADTDTIIDAHPSNRR